MLSQKRALKNSESLFFLPYLKGANPEENLDLFKQFFLKKTLKWININENWFSPQSEPHTAKLYLSVVLKHFFKNSKKKYFFDTKLTLSKMITEIFRKFVFLTIFEKGKS